jgi:hypothetical protein
MSVRRLARQPSPEDVRVRSQVTSPVASPLQSSFASTAAAAFRRQHHLPGFRPSLDNTHRASTHAASQRRFVPSSGALSLPTACSAPWLAGLFHPAAESRTSSPVQGFVHLTQPPSLLGRSCLLAVGADLLTHQGGLPQILPLDLEALLRVRAPVPPVR